MQASLKHLEMSHRRLVVMGAVLASLAFSLWFMHSSFVRKHVLAWAVERLHTDVRIRAEVESLGYNLLALRLSGQNATLTAAAAETPFFSVDAFRVDLPWTIFSGRTVIQALEIDRPRLAVTRSAEGVLNLPHMASKDRAVTAASPIEIDELVVRDLGWSDEDRALELHPTKTRIVYCKDDDRRGDHEHVAFDFLGYAFQPRRAKNRRGNSL
jgi:uncharacterized protein involved in outer membrane biogenesis